MYKYLTSINRPTTLFCTANIVEILFMATHILRLTSPQGNLATGNPATDLVTSPQKAE